MGAVRGLPLSACLQNCLHALLHFLFLHLCNTWMDVALVSHGVRAEGRRVSGSSVTWTVHIRSLCGAVTSCERLIKASAALNQIWQQANVPMLKTLESKQGLRAGQLFQLSGIHDEKQQQPSGNMQESGNCLISYDSHCQISCPIRFLQRESLEQVKYFSSLCSIPAQFWGDLTYDITGKYHMAISTPRIGRGGVPRADGLLQWFGPLDKNFNCHQQILWQASNNCTAMA